MQEIDIVRSDFVEQFILYVTKYSIFSNAYELFKYRCYTDDLYHVIGYMYCTTLEKIERISYRKVKLDEDVSDIPLYKYK